MQLIPPSSAPLRRAFLTGRGPWPRSSYALLECLSRGWRPSSVTWFSEAGTQHNSRERRAGRTLPSYAMPVTL